MTPELYATVCRALDLDPLTQGLQILDAHHLARLHFPPLDPDIPALIAQWESRELAVQCQRALSLLYPRDHLVTRFDAAANKTETVMLEHLAQGDGYGTQTIVYIPPLAQPSSFNALAEVTAHLRAPEGCPWDREQTHASLRQYLLEECYEVLETIDQGDVAHLREELGDVMSLILLQIQIARDAGEFSLSDVLEEVSAKLVRRHPHVFGDTQVNGMDELLANWEEIKGKEKRKTQKAKVDVPRALPALMRAQMVAGRQKKRLVLSKAEGLREREIATRVERLGKARDKEKALGEALFALAAYAEANGLDAESALRSVAAGK